MGDDARRCALCVVCVVCVCFPFARNTGNFSCVAYGGAGKTERRDEEGVEEAVEVEVEVEWKDRRG